MPFGLSNASATFQRLMERVLSRLQWDICLIYLDDIIIFSRTLEDHISQLQAVFARLKAANLKLKAKKCHLFRRQVAYLGHLVSEEGVAADPEKLKAVREWPRPRAVSDVRSFVGLCSYYRRFIPDFATVAKPLICLTEKYRQFKWGRAQEEAWLEMKRRLITAPVLAYPDPDRPFILDTDASDTGIGAVQDLDGQERVITYSNEPSASKSVGTV